MSKATTTRIWVSALLLAALLYSLSAEADCVLPAPPSHIPDGSSASPQEMLAAVRTFKQYNDDVDEYTKCLDFQRRRNLITVDMLETSRSSALNTLATIVGRFNEQVRRFKARTT
ncbi:MAG TPA: hypothetical protein VK696_05585 [Steroidobacteraceae bacterium]|jgi:hypothetical protein|nr:hypothetical protein [Steroidobacteraceae bacterium]